MTDIIGHGGGGGEHTHYEAADSLHNVSYARVLDLVSEGEILGLANGLGSVYLNQTPIENADGTKNFKDVSVDFRAGTQSQDYIPGFPDVENEISVGVELKSGTPWVHAISNTALSAIRITLGVPTLTKSDTSNGDVLGYRIDYQIELSKDGGAYSTVISTSFNGKTTSAYQRSARIDLPPATAGWQVRITRLTPNANTAAIADATTVVSYTEVIDAKLRYPMSAIVGIQVDARQFQSIPTRAYDLFGRIIQVPSNYDPVARTYAGVWDGTFKPAWTNNPAWIFRDLILNDRYGLGNRIVSSQVDKWALYKIARYCDETVPNGKGGTEPRFTCNLYLQSRKQAYAVLQDIASIFRGISYWGAGSIMASADMPSDPVYVYTAANVIGGKFSRSGSKKATRYTVALVTWNDPADFYKPKVEYVEDGEGIARYGIQQVELTGFGCTSQGQAQRAGRWALATSRLETEGITFDVGMDGAIALPGQIVRVADPSRMGRRAGGRVRAAAGRVVTLDKAPVINAGDKLTVILPAGVSETHTVVSVAGDAVTVDSDWSALPVAQSVWSVDSTELSAPLFRVLSVTEKDATTFTIAAVQHEPGKFAFVENGTAITQHPQTALDVTTQAPPASVALAGYTVSLNDVQKLALQVSCAPVAGAVAYEGAYRRGDNNWIAIPRQPSPTMDVLDVLPGTYMAKMAAVNSIGVTSIETQSVAVEITKDGASKNAAIILNSDAQQFHTSQAGATDPTVITVSAILIALDGPVSWSCVGGTLSNVTATTAQLAYADASGASAFITASVTAFDRTYSQSLTIRKVQDGATGASGLQTDVARLYQWAPVAPSKPTGTSTFNWPAVQNTAYNGTDGWALSANNPGTPGWRLYVASAGVSAAIAATTTPVSYTGATVEAWSQNGAAGASGVNSAAATVYQWAATIPAGPVGSPTWSWSARSFGAAPANWSLTPGTSPSAGMTLWAASVQVTDAATATSTPFNWSSAAVMAIGYAGTNGTSVTGPQGASYVTAYCASTIGTGTSAPAPTTGKTSLPPANSGGINGTPQATVPTLTAGQYQMQFDGIYDPTTNQITWSIPYQSSLKVGVLSAITANLGAINAGSINLGGGTFTVDNEGNLVCRSIKILNPDGSVMLQAGGQLNPANAAPGTLNSEVAGKGKNLLANSAPGSSAGYSAYTDSGLPLESGGPKFDANATYSPSRKAVFIHVLGTPAIGTTAELYANQNNKTPVIAGRLYEAAVNLSTFNCKSHVRVAWYAADSSYISQDLGSEVDRYQAGYYTTPFPRSFLFAVAPPGAAYAMAFVKQVHTGTAGDVYTFTSQWHFGEAFTGQTGPSPWAEGAASSVRAIGFDGDLDATRGAPAGTTVGGTDAGLVASRALNGDSAYNAVNNTATGLAQRLRANAANVLSGGAGLTAGSLTYDTNGNRTGGSGTAFNQNGLVHYAADGAADVVIGSAGVAVKADVSGSTGTFGAVTIGSSMSMGQTAYNTGIGGWFQGGATPKMSMRTANGASFLCDPANDILQLNGVSLGTFNATGTGNVSGSFPNGGATYGNLGVSITGGLGPFTYAWFITIQNKTSQSARVNLGGYDTASIVVTGSGTDCTTDFNVTCIVMDANKRAATVQGSFTVNHGRPP